MLSIILLSLRSPFSDGFSAGGSNLLFENNYVANGDDCLTVGSGAINITFRCGSHLFDMNMLMIIMLSSQRYLLRVLLAHVRPSSVSKSHLGEGGHGLSIGSLGEGGAVANVQNVL